MQHLPKLADDALRTFPRQNSETCGTIGTLSRCTAKCYLMGGGKMLRLENIPLAVMSVVSLGILFVFVVAT
jgi:hypothetical protein